MTPVRRTTAAVAASAVLGMAVVAAAAPAAFATPAPKPSPSTVLPSGLYGTTDPAYDGVWRQSLALLAQDTVKVKPATKAVDWLTGQQCASGAFPSYRADASKPCDAKLPLDSNATAAAVQALAALGGQDATVKKSVAWLKSVQNADGGWGYNPGGASDANSTSVVIGALASVGEKPAAVKAKNGKSPYDALLTFAKPCTGKDAGAFVFQVKQPGIVADSTAAGVLGALGKGLAVEGPKPVAPAACAAGATPEQAAQNGAAYLVSALKKTGHLDSAPMPGAENPAPQPDFGNTADAVTALSAAGHSDQAAATTTWLEKNSAAWAKASGPAAYAQLILAAHAVGADPQKFGGADLVKQLNATGPAPQASGAEKSDSSGSTGSSDASEKDDKDDSGIGVWWIVGAFFVASVGVGILFSGRRKKQ
ncbi:prenyltransferase/squalene oxidase repeat-containing protein [Streptomyces sp. NBC_00306]|uniref:prenyltransferase/squalene oxidase repeat-containing protein n=1 Tax=Streptomyces sp. NBC_00306 TaxID=2975708 RepID=UPI002E2B61E7|nr:prenyltransferase/squalene oxidase repeat-containing protein [Streptomyces sp. NBC_00306]